jgi:D-glycero-D-manno-heptose 1,7-bisphosphate phosphatase
MVNKAVFIDRDGTINVDGPYLSDPNKLKLYSGVVSGIRRLNKNGYKVIIITNQSGLARGFFSWEILEEVHNELKRRLNKGGARIDAIYYCPHHPDDNCSCRKPKTALFERAIADFKIDAGASFVIGDRIADVEAGHRIGSKSILIPEKGKEKRVEKEKLNSSVKPDYECENFTSAVNWILRSLHS